MSEEEWKPADEIYLKDLGEIEDCEYKIFEDYQILWIKIKQEDDEEIVYRLAPISSLIEIKITEEKKGKDE